MEPKGSKRTPGRMRPLASLRDELTEEATCPSHLPERLARAITDFSGSTAAFFFASLTVIIWAVLGPLFGYSENWQLVINTGTTIVTFLMVFLIQRAQNKDSLAIHLKLDELVAAHSGASNRLVSVEELSEHDLEVLRHHYRRLVEAAATDEDLGSAHSVEEHAADDALPTAPLRPALARKRGHHDS
jgi:low affinity Fe/Cu permease